MQHHPRDQRHHPVATDRLLLPILAGIVPVGLYRRDNTHPRLPGDLQPVCLVRGRHCRQHRLLPIHRPTQPLPAQRPIRHALQRLLHLHRLQLAHYLEPQLVRQRHRERRQLRFRLLDRPALCLLRPCWRRHSSSMLLRVTNQPLPVLAVGSPSCCYHSPYYYCCYQRTWLDAKHHWRQLCYLERLWLCHQRHFEQQEQWWPQR